MGWAGACSSVPRSAIPPMYQAVAADSRRSRRFSQASDTLADVTTSKVRPRARTSCSSANGSTLPPAEPALLAPHALGDDAQLAVVRGEERQHAVRLAQLEAAQDDGGRLVDAWGGHAASVLQRVAAPGGATRAANMLDAGILLRC